MGSFLSTLSGIVSDVSPILGAGASLLGSHKAQKASYEAIDRQNSFNEYMYNKYKNPVNASNLLLQAGINPAFAYGNIAGRLTAIPIFFVIRIQDGKYVVIHRSFTWRTRSDCVTHKYSYKKQA